ncbi:MAG: PEP-CTERM sorting domain-containing protein [Phycisphaerae bacterium]
MSVITSAEVFVEYWPVGDAPNGVNDPIEADISAGDVNITLNIGLTAPGGETLMVGADFVFSWPGGFSMTNFQWDEGNFNTGFTDNTLPAPALVAPKLRPATIPVGPDPQLALATVDVSIDASVLAGDHFITAGSFGDQANPTINDFFASPFDIDPGSGSIPFNVIPEPATLAFLVSGGFIALRRRRS